MAFDINLEAEINEDEFKTAVADVVETRFRELVEQKLASGHTECDCGSTLFDVETWKDTGGNLAGAAVCRKCNERVPIEIDTSSIDELR